MKAKFLFLTGFISLAIQAQAYDFAIVRNGKSLYFNIIGNTQNVELTNSYIGKSPNYKYDGRLHVADLKLDMQSRINISIEKTKKAEETEPVPEAKMEDENKNVLHTIRNEETNLIANPTEEGLPILECGNKNIHLSGTIKEITIDSITTKNYSGEIRIPEEVEYNGRKYTVTEIGGQAFENCTELTSILLPGSIISISPFAFSKCEKLNSIVIPNSVKTIGMGAFSISGLRSVVLPNGIKNIEDYCFSGCHLNSISLPKTVRRIGGFAFQSDTLLTNLIIPDGVTEIGKNAFTCCLNLQRITIPSSVKHLSDRIFESCLRLEQITVQSTIPIPLPDNCFENSKSSNMILKVPKGSIDRYKKAAGWKDVASIEEY